MLNTQRIALTPLQADDSAALEGWINQRDQVLSSAPYKPVSAAAHRAWFEAVQQRGDTVIFAIRLIDGDRLIGYCQLHDIHPIHRSARLQIRIGDADARGHGYGTDAVRLLLRFAFDDLNLHRVSLQVFKTNAAARRVYEKCGFRVEGELRQAAFIDGEYTDILEMGILRDEYHRAQ
jgi:RimJ/RimL family protein N-acetyltransferase